MGGRPAEELRGVGAPGMTQALRWQMCRKRERERERERERTVHSISAAVGGGEEPVGAASSFAAMDGVAGAKLLPLCGVDSVICWTEME